MRNLFYFACLPLDLDGAEWLQLYVRVLVGSQRSIRVWENWRTVYFEARHAVIGKSDSRRASVGDSKPAQGQPVQGGK